MTCLTPWSSCSASSLALAAQNPKVKLAVRADQNAPWGRMVAVMDAAKAAKITDISAYTKEAGKP